MTTFLISIIVAASVAAAPCFIFFGNLVKALYYPPHYQTYPNILDKADFAGVSQTWKRLKDNYFLKNMKVLGIQIYDRTNLDPDLDPDLTIDARIKPTLIVVEDVIAWPPSK